MSENTQVQSDVQPVEGSAPVEQAAQTQQQEEVVVTRSAEDLAKRLKEVSQEAKTYRQKLAEEKKRIAELEKRKLEESGQYQELAKRFQEEAETERSKAEKLKEAFALKVLTDKVALEAAKSGCVDPELLVNVLPIDQIKMDENFSVDQSSVKLLIEDVKRQKPYLFQKVAPKVNDVNPAAKVEQPKLDLNKLSTRELAGMLSKLTSNK